MFWGVLCQFRAGMGFVSQISPAGDEKIARVLVDVMGAEAKRGSDRLG